MHRLSTLALSLFGGVSLCSAQPSLDPPAGPIEESGRFGTLIELSQETAPGDADSVFKVTEPGSYVLTGDVRVPPLRMGIEIASSGVTIDLNGYSIVGLSSLNTTGISVTRASEGDANFDALTIRNGLITSVNEAVRLAEDVFIPEVFSSTATNAQIEGLTIADCGSGITADGASIARCSITVDDAGIENLLGSVESCKVRIVDESGRRYGIRVEDGVVLNTTVEIRSTFGDNGTGFIVNGSSVSGCTAVTHGSFSTGFAYGTRGASVTNCVARRLSGSNTVGFNGDGVTTGCAAARYFIGFASTDGVVRGCAAIECTNDEDLANGVVSDGNNF